MAQAKYEKWLEKDNLILLEAWARDGLTDEQISKNIGIAWADFRFFRKEISTIKFETNAPVRKNKMKSKKEIAFE